MSALIAASRPRVWAALTNPDEVVRWRPGLLEPVAAGRYPVVGVPVRWRCRVQDLPLLLEETPLETSRGELLRSRLRLGLFRFESTFTLSSVTGERDRTRLGLRILAANEIPVVGGTLDRFAVRRLALDLATNHLRALRDWCEASAHHAAPPPPPPPPLPRQLPFAAG